MFQECLKGFEESKKNQQLTIEWNQREKKTR